jgi:hypothetical protein
MVHSMTELQSLKLDTLLKALNTDVTQPVVFAAADRPVAKL